MRTSYVYDRGRVSFEKNASGGITVKYLNGLSCHGENRDVETYYYFTNAHGDVTEVVDSGRDMTDVFKYDEFGGITFEAHNNSIALTSFRYANEYYDTETGNYYLRSRYYDPSIGRFTQADTFAGNITDPLSLNLYTYCHNNPINFIDPSGHYAISVGGNEYIFRDDLTDEEMREISYRSMYLGNGEISIEEYISSTAAYGVSVNFNGGEPSPYDASSGRVPLEKVNFYGNMTATNIGTVSGNIYLSEQQGMSAITAFDIYDIDGIALAYSAATVIKYEISEATAYKFSLAKGFRNIGIDPIAVTPISEPNGNVIYRNYLQIVMEDMPYLRVFGGARSSSFNYSTIALANIFNAFGMTTAAEGSKTYGVFDTWNMRGAVDTVIGDYYDWSATDEYFYSLLRSYIVSASQFNEEELAALRRAMGESASFYANSLYQGQRKYEEALARQAAIEAAIESAASSSQAVQFVVIPSPWANALKPSGGGIKNGSNSNFRMFALGAETSITNGFFIGEPISTPTYYSSAVEKSTYYKGRLAGDVIVMIVGAAAIYGGIGMIFAAVGEEAFSTTVPLVGNAVVAAPAAATAVAGVAEIGFGGAIFYDSLNNLIEDSENLNGETNSGNSNSLKKIKGNKEANRIAQDLGFDSAEALKHDYVFDNGAHFNMMINSDTKEIILESITDSSIHIPTGLYVQ